MLVLGLLTSSENAEKSNPSEPTNLAECLDAGKTASCNSSHGDENSSASGMIGERIQADGNAQHS